MLQNRVYPTRDDALAAPCADFGLATCGACGFSFNGLFDADLVLYDENYDNDVPSAVFKAYYKDLAEMLIARFDLTSGVVYDIGCGKGDFLRVLCELAPAIRGVGIDPSCTPVAEDNFTLERRAFHADDAFSPDTKLVILRHVLEHIDQPVAFVAQIAKAIGPAPFFVEVPNLHWILDHDVFWDFMYEHCNYFSPNTLRHALRLAGFVVEEQQLSFNDQYQWAICRCGDPSIPSLGPDPQSEIARVRAYLAHEDVLLRSARALIDDAGKAVLWGMASKGVIFSTLIGGDVLAGGVDINAKKQGRFAPASGVAIHPPGWLADLAGQSTVFIMNGNYADEIRRQLDEMGVSARTVVLEGWRGVPLPMAQAARA